MAKKLATLRQSYELATLMRGDLDNDPSVQFANWLTEAVEHVEIAEANAMVLSTVSKDLQPSSRVVLLKEIDRSGLVFYTNYNSQKGVEIGHNNRVAVNFWWPPMQRQVRIEGRVTKVAEEQSDRYFKSRPLGSQIGAIVSPQSEAIADRDTLDDQRRQLEGLDPGSLKKPAHWGGYLLHPTYFEFWQGRPDRLHDRFAYRLNGNHWKINRLAP